MFHGYVTLGGTILVSLVTRNASNVPLNSDAAPRRHVYGPTGALVSAAAGQGSQAHTGTITNVTAANPAVVTTSAAHGLETGARITIVSVVGSAGMQTAVNTSHTITKVSATTFSLDGVNTTGESYTSGGTFNVSGFYVHSIAATAANGFEAGKTYTVLSTWAISSSARSQTDTFTVI